MVTPDPLAKRTADPTAATTPAPTTTPASPTPTADPSANDFYERLGVTRKSDTDAINKAAEKLIASYGGKPDEKQSKELENVKEAQKTLADATSRKAYDTLNPVLPESEEKGKADKDDEEADAPNDNQNKGPSVLKQSLKGEKDGFVKGYMDIVAETTETTGKAWEGIKGMAKGAIQDKMSAMSDTKKPEDASKIDEDDGEKYDAAQTGKEKEHTDDETVENPITPSGPGSSSSSG